MRQPGSPRLISMPATALSRERSYALAARSRELAGSERRWAALQYVLGPVARRKLERLAKEHEAVRAELALRFEPLFRNVLVAAGHPQHDHANELLFCWVRLHDLLLKNPRNTCMPEMMWQASAMYRDVPDPSRERLRMRFHLRALLDELPESDARAALRFFVFSTRAESAKRRGGGPDLDTVYDAGTKSALMLGLAQFARHMHNNRAQLESLTCGAICADRCQSVAAAHQYLCDTLLSD